MDPKPQLTIKFLHEEAVNYYSPDNSERFTALDSGYDCYYCYEDMVILPVSETDQVYKMRLGIAVEPLTDSGYYLFPRSSITKTPLIMANSIGVMDLPYRGELIACVRNLSNKPYVLKKGTSLFQLCIPSLKPFTVVTATELSETKRGENGFGSTNKIN